MNFRKFSIKTIVLILTITLISWANTWENLKNKSANINSISSDFIQKKYLRILSKPLISKGKLLFQRPGSLRWEYVSPIKSILLMNNNDIRRYTKHGKKYEPDRSVNMQAMQIVIQEISKWLSGDFNNNPDFNSKLIPGKNKKIVMTPKQQGLAKIIGKIELYLSNQPGIIIKVMIYENKNNYTVLLFKNTKLNKKIDKKLFQGI